MPARYPIRDDRRIVMLRSWFSQSSISRPNATSKKR